MRNWFLVGVGIALSWGCGGDRTGKADEAPSCSLPDCEAIRDLGTFGVYPIVTETGTYQVEPTAPARLLYRPFTTGENLVVALEVFRPSVRADRQGGVLYLLEASKQTTWSSSEVRGTLHRFDPDAGVATAYFDGVQAAQYDVCGPLVWAVRGYLTGVNCGRHFLYDTRTGESLDLADACDTHIMPQLGHFAPDCSSLVLGGFDVSIFQPGAEAASKVADSSSVGQYFVSDDGRSAAAWAGEGALVHISATSNAVTHVAGNEENRAWPYVVAPVTGDLLFGFESSVHVYDAATGRSQLVDAEGGTAAIASRDGTLFAWLLAAQGKSGELRVLDRRTGNITEVADDAYNFDVHWRLRSWEQAARPLAFTDDGRFLAYATSGPDDTLGVRIWDRETGETTEFLDLRGEEPPSFEQYVIGHSNPDFILDAERNRLAWADASGRLFVHALDGGGSPAQVDAGVRFFRFAGDSLFWIDRDWHGRIVPLD